MATTIAAQPPSSIPPHRNGGDGPRPHPIGTHRTGILLAVAAITMMFVGLTSAYVVSQGLGAMWKQIHMRPLMWANTVVLVFSSYTMERARRGASSRWLLATLSLGIVFLAGQIAVFGQLANEGFYLNSGRQASFYYVLSGLHGLHVLGGILALAWAAVRMKSTTLEVVSIYWHFMGALWLYLLLVIFV
jgi:cytochrome c oxidase subunit 3